MLCLNRLSEHDYSLSLDAYCACGRYLYFPSCHRERRPFVEAEAYATCGGLRRDRFGRQTGLPALLTVLAIWSRTTGYVQKAASHRG